MEHTMIDPRTGRQWTIEREEDGKITKMVEKIGEVVYCQYYQPSRYIANPKTDEGYETPAWCKLSDNHCLVEYGKPEDCEEYADQLKELWD